MFNSGFVGKEYIDDVKEYFDDRLLTPVKFRIDGKIIARQTYNGYIHVHLKKFQKTVFYGATMFGTFDDMTKSMAEQTFGEINQVKRAKKWISLRLSVDDLMPVNVDWSTCCGQKVYIHVKYLACENTKVKVNVGVGRKLFLDGCKTAKFIRTKRLSGMVNCT